MKVWVTSSKKYLFTHVDLSRISTVASSELSWLVAHFRIFRLFMKGKFDDYVLWPFAQRTQNKSTARDYTVYGAPLSADFWTSYPRFLVWQLLSKFYYINLGGMYLPESGVPYCNKYLDITGGKYLLWYFEYSDMNNITCIIAQVWKFITPTSEFGFMIKTWPS